MTSHRNELLTYLRLLLTALPNATAVDHPLSVLLFSLDLSAFIEHSTATSNQIERVRLEREGETSSNKNDLDAVVQERMIVDGEHEASRQWYRRNAGSSPSVSPELASSFNRGRFTTSKVGEIDEKEGNDQDRWKDWFGYLNELYAIKTTEWTSPFFLSPSTIPSLRALLTLTDQLPARLAIAQLAAEEATTYLNRLNSSFGPLSSFDVTSDGMKAEVDLPSALFARLKEALELRRGAMKRERDEGETGGSSILTFRYVLTSLLSHYFGASNFSQTIRRDGEFSYSKHEEDDAAISNFWKIELVEEDIEHDDDGVEVGHASIVRKDEKLRRVLGDNFRTGAATPPTNITPPRASRPVSSSMSLSSSSSTLDSRHRRIASSASSTIPLITTVPRSPTIVFHGPAITETFGNLAPTISNLSPESRRDLVRRTRKLKGIFGVPLEEGVLSDPTIAGDPTNLRSFEMSRLPQRSPSMSRRSSYPPSPDSSILFFEQSGQEEGLYSPAAPFEFGSPFSPSAQSTFHRRIAISSSSGQQRLEPTSPKTILPSRSNSTLSLNETMTEAERKETRRRKIQKLQRWLGDRVPTHLALNEESWNRNEVASSAQRESSEMNRSGSSRLGGILKGAGERLGWSGNGSSKTRDSEGVTNLSERGEENFVVVDAPNESFTVNQRVTSGTVQGLVKTRKMERVFGDIPPPALYLQRSSNIFDRRPSETPTMSSIASNSTPPIDPEASLTQQQQQSSSNSLRCRHSIASLRYLIEKEPESFESIAREYSRDFLASSVEQKVEEEADNTDIPDSDKAALQSYLQRTSVISPPFSPPLSSTSSSFDPRPLPTALPHRAPSTSTITAGNHRRSQSLSSAQSKRRTLARASKLSNFFGTSKGEVWKMLLDDVEASVNEELEAEDMEPSERESLTRNWMALKQSAGL